MGQNLMSLCLRCKRVGKTTTIGKQAARFGDMKAKKFRCSGGTFEPRHSSQLRYGRTERADYKRKHTHHTAREHTGRTGIRTALKPPSQGYGFVFGRYCRRLHSKVNLMEELKKSNGRFQKSSRCPSRILLFLDATTVKMLSPGQTFP
jgi:signal recognition particle GTPase